VIPAELATFLEGGISAHIATRGSSLDPNGARVASVKVDADGHHVTAYVPKVAAASLLADLRANPQAALCVVRPTDDKGWQLKGEFVGARAATAREREHIERQWDAFLENLDQIGLPRQLADGWKTWPAVAIRLRVTALFSQTPGPGAGAPVA
jgi:hypothetical protein